MQSLLGLVCALAPVTTGPCCEAETLGTATVQIISIDIISTSITVVSNSSNLINCFLGNRDSIPMDFMPRIGNYSSHVHKIAVQATINCIKPGISDKSTDTRLKRCLRWTWLGDWAGSAGVSSSPNRI